MNINDNQSQSIIWTQIERKCLLLLQQRKNSKLSLLQIHAFMLRHSIESNLKLLAKFISTCSSIPFTGILHARRLFDHSLHRTDNFICNTMLKAHVDNRQFKQCITLYQLLRFDLTGFIPDNYTFSSLAKACGLSKGFWEGQEIHNHVLKLGFLSNLFASTSLVDMYSKFGSMNYAHKLFDEMPVRSQVSWTVLVDGYARNGDLITARNIFHQSPAKDCASYNVMIDAYVKILDMDSARYLFDEMPERNVVSWTSIIDGYCNQGDVNSARLLFDTMPNKNLYSWNAMIGGYSRNKQSREALRLFDRLESCSWFEPDTVTIVSILPAVADLGALDWGIRLHCFVTRKKLDRATNVCTALIDMYAKCGEIEKAIRIFKEMPEKELATWNALINGLAINGKAKEALEVFSNMKRNGFIPNEITLLGVLSACNHSGLVEEGKKWFNAFDEFNLKPGIEHYGCLIHLLGKSGCLEEAEKLIEEMPYDVNGVVLSSFLSACGFAKDVERVERMKKKAIEMEPWNDGNYVMLRNLYAEERKWNEVEEIKGLMKKKGAKKEIGFSVIEVEGRVLEFIAGDQMYQEEETMIFFILGNLFLHMTDYGSCT
ncbi:pentatricopeptide repeat-containing protein At2g44880 [Impatiens glandulifera]|uniref:pentatricopeptide repeat-containing protein At2g44880 n=1 Tax=Impatiens glandulifera TaxID=253017 RepID=UPI001FB070DC|nr:pentatricopeptide repeat-containing protein At2g44880 [Impatiens glandulifera]